MYEFPILEYNLSRINTQFFISPDGKVHKWKGKRKWLYECEILFHDAIARQLLPNAQEPKDALMKMGYCLVGSTVYHLPYCCKEPTQAQINTLDRLNMLDLLQIMNGSIPLSMETQTRLYNALSIR